MSHIVSVGTVLHALILSSTYAAAIHKFSEDIDSDNKSNKEEVPNDRKWLTEIALKNAMRHTEILNIYIRKDYLQKDTYNPYVFWLQQRCLCVVTLNTYNPKTLLPLANLLPAPKAEGFAIVSDLQYFHTIAFHYAQRSGKYFFIFDKPLLTSMQKIVDILNLIWKHRKVSNIYVLSPDYVYYYDPLAVDYEHGNHGKLNAYMGDESIHKLIFGDMRGFPIKVQIFNAVYSIIKIDNVTGKTLKLAGIDGEALKMLKEILNFTIILNKPNIHLYGTQFSNGSFNGAIGEILREECDFCASGFFVKDYKAPFIDFSIPVYGDRLCIYMAKAQKVPLSILPIYVMGKSIITFIIAGFIFGLIICIFRYINEQIFKYKADQSRILQQYVLIFIDMWVVWVRRPIMHLPPYRSERIFIATIALLSVIYGVIFESGLSTAYIEPYYYADLNTLKELDESGLEIFYKFTSFSDIFFSVYNSPLLESLNRKLRYVNNLSTCLLNYTKEHPTQVASISRYSSLHLNDLKEIIESRIWVLPECPQYYSIAYVMPKKSPFKNAIDFQLQHMLSAGFFTYWENRMHIEATSKLAYIKSKTTLTRNKKLDLNDLQLSMYILFAGLLLSIFVFCCEVLVERYWNHKRIYFLK